MKFSKYLLPLLFVFSFSFKKQAYVGDKVVYKSDNLVIVQLSENVYQHISFLKTESFGKVACNGMVVNDSNEALVLDTPVNDSSSAELILWIKNELHSKIKAVVATHFHEDCVGGLKEFDANNISSYATNKTRELAKKNNFNVPFHGFDDSLILEAGSKKINIEFFGEGHTKDNVIAYVPSENILFGGCLVKEMNATKGFLGDANVEAWPKTVEKIRLKYPDVKLIIPGHGKHGGKELLDYTIGLFKK